MKKLILLIFYFYLFLLVESQSNLKPYTCILKNDQYYVTEGIYDNGVAFALVDLNYNETGWNYISINTSSEYPDSVQSQAAGYLEGYLSHESIEFGRINFFMKVFNSLEVPSNISVWIEDNIEFMQSKIEENKFKDKKKGSEALYWYHVSLILDQISYMVQGYNDIVFNKNKIRMTLIDFFILNMAGDLYDLTNALIVQGGGSITPPLDLDKMAENQHCSSFIKLTDDFSEIYAGHTSWTWYTSMIRSFKSISFSYSNESQIISSTSIFSAYPGTLSSIDDFYLLENQMVVMETTNNVFNYSLYEAVSSQSVLSWIRVLVANRLGNSSLEWCNIISQYNSGTYNNQWIVFDYRKFTPNVSLDDGALYILEQLPGVIEFDDQTDILRMGYWPSYNIPFYKNIYNISGMAALASKVNASVSQQLSYSTNCRSEIFRRDANSVYSISDFMNFMRYNDYENDPLSQKNPSYSICSRFDLMENPKILGGIDSKVTSYALLQQNLVLAINGPTTYDNIEPFSWSSNPMFANFTHIGMPDSFNFDWVSIGKDTYQPYPNGKF